MTFEQHENADKGIGYQMLAELVKDFMLHNLRDSAMQSLLGGESEHVLTGTIETCVPKDGKTTAARFLQQKSVDTKESLASSRYHLCFIVSKERLRTLLD